jgi:2-octaprenyl-6-methoxyphenol hydroxylase
MRERPMQAETNSADIFSDAPPPADYHFDITIVGAGPVGLALAGWLAKRSATSRLSVALIDARAPGAASADPRSIAVSHASRAMLESLAFPSDATPIKRIHVSQRGHFGRTLIDHDEHGVPALGYVVRYGSLVTALTKAVHETSVHWFTETTASTPLHDHDGVTLSTHSAQGDHTIHTRILVNAEGGLYKETDTSTEVKNTRDYRQTAIVGTVSVSSPQPGVAWERFTPEGPIALLPCGGARQADYSLVWCCTPDEAARRSQLADDAFLAELGVAFGERMGRFTRIAGRATFPLGLNALNALVDRRTVAIGNAAQTLHPVAGQGLNLGLRDAHALCDALSSNGPTTVALSLFAQRRALDRRMTIGATDTLARLFTIDFAPLAALRGLALSALEFVPPLKTVVARQMMFGQRR